MLPEVASCAYVPPVQLAAQLDAAGIHVVLLESANAQHIQTPKNRYSYIGLDPFEVVEANETVWDQLAHTLHGIEHTRHANHPPFQGGLIGYLGYELHQTLEATPCAPRALQTHPLAMWGHFDCVIAFDHQRRAAWCFSTGLPETQQPARRTRAHARLAWCLETLATLPPCPAPTMDVIPESDITPVMTREAYFEAFHALNEHILAGDIYEANLTQAFMCAKPKRVSSLDLYRRLRHRNPAAFAAWLSFGSHAIVSASPEQFLHLQGDRVTTSPIKGTCPRGQTPEADQALADALSTCVKNRAENVMIVDLMRNDLSRVCMPGSVKVPALCALETLPTVHHLVSTVAGQLAPDASVCDLLKATFPGGSITGAPKIRAMEIIAACEPVTRGPYCGSVFYLGYEGSMHASIVIRTLLVNDETIVFNAGGAIVADSNPETEYDESLMKAWALQQSLCAPTWTNEE